MERSGFLLLVVPALSMAHLAGCAAPPRAGRDASASAAVQREQIEWCDMWVTHADKAVLPRVLLVGDSIARGYFDAVEKRLAGKACCARATTSKGINDPFLSQEIGLMLAQYRFAVVHINNGLHGAGCTDEQYRNALAPLIQDITSQSGGASIIWAQTTPVLINGRIENRRTEHVRSRNRIAASFAAAHAIPVNDLFGLVADHPEYYSPDGVHFNPTGIEAQARQVADCVLKALDSRSGRP
jgi:hypothetical protein